MLNPIHLRTLVEVVRQGSFAGAANRLGYTASAVSQQMTSLEQAAGVQLFERTARSARPTEAARLMAKSAVPVFADLEGILEAARRTDESNSNMLDVSVYASLARAVMPRVLQDAQLVSAGIKLRLLVHNPSLAIRAIRDGEWPDVALIYQHSTSDLTWPANAKQVRLGSEPYVLLLSERAAQGFAEAPTAAFLSTLEWGAMHPGSSDATAVEHAFRAAGIHPRVTARSDEFEVLIDLVASGSFASFVPRSTALALPPGVVTAEFPGLALRRTVHALVAPSAPPERTHILLDALRRELPEFMTDA